jgi:glycosyltransferase involved in cell wall biosynthesis
MTDNVEVRVSCIIPTLNREEVLRETIRQLLEQTTALFEIIVIDQTAGPDPFTRAKLEEWNNQRIHWLRQREANASKARNAGALTATSDILLFLDDDVQLGPEFVAAHAGNYLDPTVAAVSGQVLERGREVTTDLRVSPQDSETGWIRFPKNYSERCITSWMAGGNFSVRRSIYFEVGGMDENYKRGAFREETDFAMRFLHAGYRFQFDPAASIVHLGIDAVPKGGARSWENPFEWHHYIGDWYFNLKFLSWKNASQLFCYSIRHLIVSRRKIQRPWLIIISLVAWLSAIPVAVVLRLRGARLISKFAPGSSTSI